MGARADLEELLTAFGMSRARASLTTSETRAGATKAQLSGAPVDPVARLELWREELEAAAPLLSELVARIRTLRSTPALPTEDEYRAERRDIALTWNAAIYERGWKELPPLCAVCGTPVLRRGGELLPSGDYDLSTVCSDKCRSTKRQRESRARRG
jgi:hypothetical protein